MRTATFNLLATPAPWDDGDRVSFPAHVLALLDQSNDNAANSSKQPLWTFEIRLDIDNDNGPNQEHSRVACGVRDFANPDDASALVPRSLLALLLGPDSLTIEQQVAVTFTLVQLPPATAGQLRPIVSSLAYLTISDMRAVLESHLRTHCTTLTRGAVLHVPAFLPATLALERIAFRVESISPGDWAAVVINTDVAIDVLPASDDPAVLKQLQLATTTQPILDMLSTGPLSVQGRAIARLVDVVAASGSLTIPAPDPTWLHVTARPSVPGTDVNLFVHPYLRPSATDCWAMAVDGIGSKSVVLNIAPALQSTEWRDVFVSVEPVPIQGAAPSSSVPLDDAVSTALSWEILSAPEPPVEWVAGLDQDDDAAMDVDEDRTGMVKCDICEQWIPAMSLTMHQLHCARNTSRCATCKKALPRAIAPHHVHCAHCNHLSTEAGEAAKHSAWHHPDSLQLCPTCPVDAPGAAHATAFALQEHHMRSCPGRIEWCRFCFTHTAAGENAAIPASARLGGITTSHGAECAARTIDCAQCGKAVRRALLAVHAALHREARRRPPLHVCANHSCGRVFPVSAGPKTNGSAAWGKHGLCAACYAPMYSSRAPPPGTSEAADELKRAVHRYFRQAAQGCGRRTCTNLWCATAAAAGHGDPALVRTADDRTALALECMALAKRLVGNGTTPEAWFCVSDARGEMRRHGADQLAAEHGWPAAWCLQGMVKTEPLVFPSTDDEDDDDDKDQEEEDHAPMNEDQRRAEWISRAVAWLLENAPST
ncbi:hypothetical protein BC828DRAFT_392193 [Blastocladiella britannica]|nr:hypothetical protein BC828DRAFT_392193 [Blastocladiella britannica]